MFRLNGWVDPQPFVANPFDKSATQALQNIEQVWFALPHNSLTWGWWPLEWIPKAARWREWRRRVVAGLYLPRGEPRVMQDGDIVPLIHRSVVEMAATAYRPVNLPERYRIER